MDPRSEEGERKGMSRYCDHLEKRVAVLEAENAVLKKRVEVLGRMVERLPSVAEK